MLIEISGPGSGLDSAKVTLPSQAHCQSSMFGSEEQPAHASTSTATQRRMFMPGVDSKRRAAPIAADSAGSGHREGIQSPQGRTPVSGSCVMRAPLALVLLALASCSSSVVIRRDDPVYAHARGRLLHTQAVVDRLPASPDEKLRFLQAEGFYRYRFEFPARSAGVRLAEAAAIIVELPAFQSLAGSLDLL